VTPVCCELCREAAQNKRIGLHADLRFILRKLHSKSFTAGIVTHGGEPRRFDTRNIAFSLHQYPCFVRLVVVGIRLECRKCSESGKPWRSYWKVGMLVSTNTDRRTNGQINDILHLAIKLSHLYLDFETTSRPIIIYVVYSELRTTASPSVIVFLNLKLTDLENSENSHRTCRCHISILSLKYLHWLE